jgi:hypothetical protein
MADEVDLTFSVSRPEINIEHKHSMIDVAEERLQDCHTGKEMHLLAINLLSGLYIGDDETNTWGWSNGPSVLRVDCYQNAQAGYLCIGLYLVSKAAHSRTSRLLDND